MAKRRKNQDADFAQRRERALSAHMWSLECFTVDDYLTWCSSRGFRADTHKSTMNMRRELEYHKRERAVEHLRQSRIARNPIDVIGAVCAKTMESTDIRSVRLREVCARIPVETLAKHELRSLHKFLTAIWKVSRLPVESEQRNRRQLNYIDALIGVHRLRRRWMRSVDQWRPQTHNREKQFLSLVRHLLISYAVPEFFGSVWFRTDEPAARYQQWYVDVGNGRNPREGPSPVPLTRKIAHYFLQAPKGYGVEQAVRFGHIKALGGSIDLCNAVIETRLGDDSFGSGRRRSPWRSACMDSDRLDAGLVIHG